MDSILSLVVIICSLHCCCMLPLSCHYHSFYTSCPPSTCLVRARHSARQLSRSPACAALSRDRDSRSPHSWLPAHFCMFTPATRPRAPALARDHLSCTARFPGFPHDLPAHTCELAPVVAQLRSPASATFTCASTVVVQLHPCAAYRS